MIRTYARVTAVLLLGVAIAGLVVLGWSVEEVFYHLSVGLLFGYAGFWQRDNSAVLSMVGGLGVLVIALKAAELLSIRFMRVSPLHLDPHHITCMVVGITAILAARYLPDDTPGAER